MKKLNRKGFTLVELLAVIVILAIVVGIALVTVLPTLDKSKEKSFDIAVDAIRTYIQEQVDLSQLSSDIRGNSYNQAIATCETECNQATGDILSVTGYDKNLSAIQWTTTNGRVTITCATVSAKSDYKQPTVTKNNHVPACS